MPMSKACDLPLPRTDQVDYANSVGLHESGTPGREGMAPSATRQEIQTQNVSFLCQGGALLA